MIIYDILQYILFTPVALFIGYVFVLSVLALLVKENKNFKTAYSRRFAIVIPAHNEQLMIAHTLYSIYSMIYPKHLYEVFVIADNCTDDTAGISEKIGATVLERTNNEERGKGYALKWAFKKIIQQGKFDAIVVFDADSHISGNFLTVMNYYLEQGSKVIQSTDLVEAQSDNWNSQMTLIGFTLYNVVRPLGRKYADFSMGLRGNGMCFTSDVLEENPWEAYSLTEDIEYGIKLILEGINIDFAPEAKVVAKLPEKLKNAESQRQRWEMGRYPIISKYSIPLLKQFFKKRSLTYLDTFLDLVMPPMVNLLLLISLFFMLNIGVYLLGYEGALLLSGLWGALLMIALLHLLIGFKAAKAEKKLYVALFHVPKYAIWKLALYAKSMIYGGQKEWVRTSRDAQAAVPNSDPD